MLGLFRTTLLLIEPPRLRLPPPNRWRRFQITRQLRLNVNQYERTEHRNLPKLSPPVLVRFSVVWAYSLHTARNWPERRPQGNLSELLNFENFFANNLLRLSHWMVFSKPSGKRISLHLISTYIEYQSIRESARPCRSKHFFRFLHRFK